MGFIVPSAFVLFFHGYIDSRTKRLLREVVSSATAYEELSSQNEEFLIILKRCKFEIESYGIFDLSFSTVGEVSSQ